MSYNREKNNLRAMGIYKNKKGQNIYYNRRNKKGYIVMQDDFKKFRLISNRLPAGIMVGTLLYAFAGVDLIWSVTIGTAFFLGCEYYFRNIMLANMNVVKKVDDLDFVDMNEMRKNQPTKNIIIKFIAYIGAAIGLVVLTFISDYSELNKILLYLVAAYAGYLGILNGIALLPKKK